MAHFLLFPSVFVALDFETTGLFRPRPLSVAAARLSAGGAVQEELYTLIRPGPGAQIEPGALAKHGLSLEKCAAEGLPSAEAFERLAALCRGAKISVGFNIPYDIDVLANWCRDLNRPGPAPRAQICLMRALTPICNLPGKYGKPKWPRLEEAYRHCFGRELAGAHNAREDLKATCELFVWWLQKTTNSNAPLPSNVESLGQSPHGESHIAILAVAS